MTKEENEALMYASDEDIAFYQKCEEGLYSIGGINGTGKDEDGIPIPYHCGPHSLRSFREVIEIVQPKTILEIGFNCGHSSSMWLNLSDASVWSCDVSKKGETLHGAKHLKAKYKERFSYKNRNDKDFKNNFLSPSFYDLIFIDGTHEFDFVVEDIKLAIDLRIPYLCMDDWIEDFGEVQKAVSEFDNYLELVSINGNIALLKNKTV